jgi:hypothetical protein
MSVALRNDRTIAILFMVGSACFALGALPGYASAVGAKPDSVTFFVGSLLFTAAAAGQFRQSAEKPHDLAGERTGWWAVLIQLAGTIFFNASTLHALANNLSASQQNQKIWRPDAFGSVCFLVASGLAWRLAGRGWLSWRPQRRPWWIALLNLVGSVAFGASAVAGYVVPSSGTPWNAQVVNIGTFVGALCFMFGAYLLLPSDRTTGKGG